MPLSAGYFDIKPSWGSTLLLLCLCSATAAAAATATATVTGVAAADHQNAAAPQE